MWQTDPQGKTTGVMGNIPEEWWLHSHFLKMQFRTCPPRPTGTVKIDCYKKRSPPTLKLRWAKAGCWGQVLNFVPKDLLKINKLQHLKIKTRESLPFRLGS